jgi:hypothetical protein
VDRLRHEGQVVTIEAICRLSRELDPEGKGIQKAGILGNAEAYAYYRQHSISYQAAHKRKPRRPRQASVLRRPQPDRIAAERDMDQARRRYLQTTKAELVERLLEVEQAYAHLQQQLARLQFELLGQQVQQAEAALQGRELLSQQLSPSLSESK